MKTKEPVKIWRILLATFLVVVGAVFTFIVVIFLFAFVQAIKYFGPAKHKAAQAQVKNFVVALEMYKHDNGFFPTTEQGLQALVEAPTTEPRPPHFRPGGYLPSIPFDPWINEYLYQNPGPHGEPFSIVSLGGDGKPGGEGLDADIESWRLDER